MNTNSLSASELSAWFPSLGKLGTAFFQALESIRSRNRKLLVLACGIAFLPLVLRAETSALATAKVRYEQQRAAVQAADAAERKAFFDRYITTLHAMRAKAQGAGDLGGALEIYTEQERVTQAQTPPIGRGGSPELEKVYVALRENLRQLEMKSAGSMTRLAGQFDTELEALQKSLTKAGQRDQAQAVQAERKALAKPTSFTASTTATAQPANDATQTDAKAAYLKNLPVVPPGKLLWRIGKVDGDWHEFALASRKFKNFQDDADYTIGVSSPEKDWPYFQPGPVDAWAGKRKHEYAVNFTVTPLQAASAVTLNLYVLAVLQSFPPHLQISLNGVAREIALKKNKKVRGLGDADLGIPCVERASFPAGTLKAGKNRLTILNPDGSIFVYDALELVMASAP